MVCVVPVVLGFPEWGESAVCRHLCMNRRSSRATPPWVTLHAFRSPEVSEVQIFWCLQQSALHPQGYGRGS